MIGESGLAAWTAASRRRRGRATRRVRGGRAGDGGRRAAPTDSYNRNRTFLQETDALGSALHKVPPAPPAAPIERIVPRLDTHPCGGRLRGSLSPQHDVGDALGPL